MSNKASRDRAPIIGSALDRVSFSASVARETLESGRKVEVGRSEDGKFFSFRMGNLDNPEDCVRFALSTDAVAAMRRLLDCFDTEENVWRWVFRTQAKSSAEPVERESSRDANEY